MLGTLLKPDYEKLIRDKDWKKLRAAFVDLDPPDLAEILEDFPVQDSALVFRILPRDQQAVVFEYLLDAQTVAMNLCLCRHRQLIVLKTTYDESIKSFARATFNYGLIRNYPVYLSTKNTILKQ